jgi:hypothetical protein
MDLRMRNKSQEERGTELVPALGGVATVVSPSHAHARSPSKKLDDAVMMEPIR